MPNLAVARRPAVWALLTLLGVSGARAEPPSALLVITGTAAGDQVTIRCPPDTTFPLHLTAGNTPLRQSVPPVACAIRAVRSHGGGALFFDTHVQTTAGREHTVALAFATPPAAAPARRAERRVARHGAGADDVPGGLRLVVLLGPSVLLLWLLGRFEGEAGA